MTRQPINTHGSLNAPADKRPWLTPRTADKHPASLHAPADKKTMAHPVGAQAL